MLKKKKTGRNRKAGEEQAPPAPVGRKGKLAEVFDIPPSALPGICQMELSDNREAIIDGCQGVLEYDENVIKLTTGKMAVRFTGRGLQIKVLTHDSAVVSGFITGIEFIV